MKIRCIIYYSSDKKREKINLFEKKKQKKRQVTFYKKVNCYPLFTQIKAVSFIHYTFYIIYYTFSSINSLPLRSCGTGSSDILQRIEMSRSVCFFPVQTRVNTLRKY